MNTQPTSNKEKIISGLFLVVFLANIISGVMLQSYNSTISLQIDVLGHPASIAGLTIFMGLPGSFLIYFFGGRLNNALGRKKTAVVGFLIYSFFNLLNGFSGNLFVMFLSRFLMMIGYGMASSALSVMITDIVPRSRLTEGVGYFGLGTSLSSAFAPTIALALFSTAFAYKAVMSFAAGIGMLAVLLLLFFCRYEKTAAFQARLQEDLAATKRENKGQEKGIWGFLEKKAVVPTLLAMISTIGLSICTMYITHFAKESHIDHPGWFFTFSAVSMVAARLTTWRLVDKKGAAICVIPGLLLSTGALLLLPLAPGQPVLLYLSGLLNGFGQGMAAPALNTTAVLAAPPERRSYASSTFMLQYTFGFGLGSLFWGFLIDLLAYSRCFLMGGGILFCTTVAAAIYYRRAGLPQTMAADR